MFSKKNLEKDIKGILIFAKIVRVGRKVYAGIRRAK
jgi:hypothetical protein